MLFAERGRKGLAGVYRMISDPRTASADTPFTLGTIAPRSGLRGGPQVPRHPPFQGVPDAADGLDQHEIDDRGP